MSDIASATAAAEAKLVELDPILGEIILSQGPLRHEPQTDYFGALCRSIIGQQVSTSAASAIFSRFSEVSGLIPLNISKLNQAKIRAIGLSRQKAGYLIDLAIHFTDNPEIYNHLSESSDSEVMAELTAVKGIGAWTAQMFLMFTLVRLDVFAPADVGLQKAIIRLYGLKKPPSSSELEVIAAKWVPYRTVACWHLWRLLDVPGTAWE